jgi:hypothetical protein
MDRMIKDKPQHVLVDRPDPGPPPVPKIDDSKPTWVRACSPRWRCRRRLWSRIAAMPARTVEGMHAKIAFASSFNLLERGDLVEGTVDDLLVSAAMDYADIHGQEARS